MRTRLAGRFFYVVIAYLALLVPSPAYPELVKSNFATSVSGESVTVVWVAKEQALFRKYGLDVQLILMPRAPLSIAALLAGEIDMAITGPGHLLNAATGGAEVIGVANFFQKLDYALTSRPEIKRPEDLAGKRVAISGPGATSHIVALLALQNLRIDPNQAKIAFLTIPGTELNRRLALESGSVDATTLRGAMGEIYRNKGYPTLFNFAGSGITLPQTMVLTTRRIAANKPQLVEGYVKSFIEGIAFIAEPANKEIVKRIMASHLRLTNPADVEESYQSVSHAYERIPYANLDAMKRLHGVLTSINPKLAGVRPETVVDNSFIKKLESSGFVESVYRKP